MNNVSMRKKGEHKINVSYNPDQYAELLEARKLMTSDVVPDDLGDVIGDAPLVRKLSLLGVRYLKERAARHKKSS